MVINYFKPSEISDVTLYTYSVYSTRGNSRAEIRECVVISESAAGKIRRHDITTVPGCAREKKATVEKES